MSCGKRDEVQQQQSSTQEGLLPGAAACAAIAEARLDMLRADIAKLEEQCLAEILANRECYQLRAAFTAKKQELRSMQHQTGPGPT